MMQDEFRQCGYRVFGLMAKTGHDGEELPEKEQYKKPYSAGYQATPVWSDDQFETMHLLGQFDTGYGVLCRGLVVVDVDARNGGIESLKKLRADCPEVGQSGLTVFTGSGGGSVHMYFKAPEGVSLVSHLSAYPGIDFKSSGYVVGPGSMHLSGARYTVDEGSPEEIEDAPESLVAMLKQPERHRASMGDQDVDISIAELRDMINHVANDDLHYEDWVKIGMSIHHASGGTDDGYKIWVDWSSTSAKHDEKLMEKRWHSFGKSVNPVTLGTLAYFAEQGGWVAPVTFVSDTDFGEIEEPVPDDGLPFDLSGVDLMRPPGFVGEVHAYIAAQPRRARDRIAVAAALVAVGNIIGLRMIDKRDKVTGNLFAFCVAGSGTGKEGILGAFNEIHRIAGLGAASHGAIKSEQELVRNLIRHQPSYYAVDEISDFLEKIQNARKKGTAAYLEGVIATLMTSYSKGNSYMPLTGDLKQDMRNTVMKDIAKVNKQIDDEGESTDALERLEELKGLLSSIDDGLKHPFVSLIGFGTPDKFANLVDFRSATEGFIGRSLIFNELDNAPSYKYDYKSTPMPPALEAQIMSLAGGGFFSTTGGRIKAQGERVQVPTDAAADAMLNRLTEWLDMHAKLQTEATGLEALYLRGYEIVSKVSFILAAPSGLRTAEHVRWATALVLKDLEDKTNLVMSNDRMKDAPALALRAKVLGLVPDDDWATMSTIVNKCRAYKKEDVEKTLDDLTKKSLLKKKEGVHPTNKRKYYKFQRKG